MITLEDSKKAFIQLLKKVDNREEFLSWISDGCPAPQSEEHALAERSLKDIAVELRERVPPGAVLPSESLYVPKRGENSDCLPEFTLHVDEFLYDDDDVEELVDRGHLSKTYCKDCGSKNSANLVFISHSAPRNRLRFIFCALLPPVDTLTVLDVGSRLGATLYAAYLYTKAKNIIGVEMNTELCEIQREVISKHKFQPRIQVVEADIMNCESIVKQADVIVLHNVFEFFLPIEKQEDCWKFLNNTVRPGTLLVTTPSLESSFKLLQTGIDITSWVREEAPYNDELSTSWQDEATQVSLYRVL